MQPNFALYINDGHIAIIDKNKLVNMRVELCRPFEVKDLIKSHILVAVQVFYDPKMGMVTVC